MITTGQKLLAKTLDAALLIVGVVGLGVMAQNLTQDIALALLANTIATGAALFVLITILAPLSGAHFNPAVTLVMMMRGNLSLSLAAT
ncbi:MAG: glycerol uptake facilitator-like aquaporin [Paracoccaceae bacterium]|jgi:glycerol uptake facilitator-like aquaporin